MRQQQGSQNEPGENGDDQEPGAISRFTGTAIAFWVFVILGAALWVVIHDNITDPAKSFEVFIASMFSLALVIVVIIQAGIYFRQAKALDAQQKIMQTQARTMDASLKFGMRAYVGIHSIRFNAHNKRVFIEIENVGRRPAHHITVSGQLEVHVPVPAHPTKDERHEGPMKELTRPRSRESPTENPDRPIKGGVVINLVPIVRDFGRTKLYPGNLRILIMLRLDESLRDEELSLITEGVAVMRAKGTVRYNDGFNSGQTSDFAFRYFLADDLWILDPIIPPGGSNQNADEQAENQEGAN